MGRKGTKKEVRRYDKNAYTETLEPLVLPQAMHLNIAVYEIVFFLNSYMLAFLFVHYLKSLVILINIILNFHSSRSVLLSQISGSFPL